MIAYELMRENHMKTYENAWNSHLRIIWSHLRSYAIICDFFNRVVPIVRRGIQSARPKATTMARWSDAKNSTTSNWWWPPFLNEKCPECRTIGSQTAPTLYCPIVSTRKSLTNRLNNNFASSSRRFSSLNPEKIAIQFSRHGRDNCWPASRLFSERLLRKKSPSIT